MRNAAPYPLCSLRTGCQRGRGQKWPPYSQSTLTHTICPVRSLRLKYFSTYGLMGYVGIGDADSCSRRLGAVPGRSSPSLGSMFVREASASPATSSSHRLASTGAARKDEQNTITGYDDEYVSWVNAGSRFRALSPVESISPPVLCRVPSHRRNCGSQAMERCDEPHDTAGSGRNGTTPGEHGQCCGSSLPDRQGADEVRRIPSEPV